MAGPTRDPEPPELAALVDLSERPRLDDWSFRAALTRYAQPEPVRVSKLLNGVRRLEFALADHQKTLRARGPEIWQAMTSDTPPDVDLAPVIDLLATMRPIDVLADELVAWAAGNGASRAQTDNDRLGRSVDAVTAATVSRLEAMGVPEQERPRPPRGRG